MADVSQFPTVGGNAPTPSYSPTTTPEEAFQLVKSIYPNAVFNGGGRTAARNAAVGGVPNSMHLTDQAMDFNVPGVPSSQVFAAINNAGFPETEELNEGQVGNQGGHLHLGWRPKGNTTAQSAPQSTSQFPTVEAAPVAPQSGSQFPTVSQFPSVQQPPTAPTTNPGASFGAQVGANVPKATPSFGDVGQTLMDLVTPGQANHNPNALEQGIMGVAGSKPIQGITGAYNEGVSSGLLMQPTRQVMETMGVGMDKLKAAYPGQSDQWYQTHLHDMYNDAVTAARSGAARQTAANPYPGHQVGNTLATIASQPENLLMGGGGVGANVATRIATAGAANAAINTASDAAAQGMDMLEGQQKKWDVDRSLAAAGTGLVLGGVLHSAIEATPFVKGLFADRGMDTTPNDDPRGTTTPTTNGLNLSPNDQAHFKDLLRYGTVDDIKNFLADKQGPKPTYQSVNDLIQFRDSLPDQFVGKDNFQEAANQQINESQRQAVEDHVNNITSGWKNAPEINVVHGPEDIQDPQVRQDVMAKDPNGDALGVYGNDGKVHIFSGRISDPDVASAVTFHESLGHAGLQEAFGDKLDSTLQSLLDRNVNQFSKDTDAWQAKNPGAYGGDRLRAAEEVLAERSQNGVLPGSWQDAVSAAVRQFGRKMGLKLAYSDAEVNQVLRMAHDATVNGTTPRGNGFRGATPDPQNKFMFTGQKAKTFDPYDQSSMMPSDGSVRNEISDNYSHLITNPETGYPHVMDRGKYRMEDVLHHPALYDAYPELKDTQVKSTYLQDLAGGYEPSIKTIFLDRSGNEYDMHRTLLHETQHAIQHIEGHITDNADPQYSSHAEYMADPIEKEAYATENRLGMSPAERAGNPARFMRGKKDDGSNFKPILFHGGSDFDSVNTNKFGSGEPSNIRPLGKDGLYGSLAMSPEEIPTAIEHARIYSKYGGDNPTIHAFGTDIDQQHLDNVGYNHAQGQWARAGKSGQYELEALPWKPKAEMSTAIEASVHPNRLDRIGKWSASTSKEQIMSDLKGMNVFMRKSQMAATPGHMSDDLDRVYKSLDENYHPTTVSWEEQQRSAMAAGFKPSQIKDLADISPGELSVRLHRLGAATNMADMELSRLEAKMNTPEWSVGDQQNYLKTLANFNTFAARLKGDKAEYARALNASKIFSSYTNSTMAEIADKLAEANSGLHALTDHDSLLKFANQVQALRNGGNPAAAHTMMAGVNKPYWWQYANTLWHNSMLSGLSTHFKSTLDMLTGIGLNTQERILAMPIGQLRKMIVSMGGGTAKPSIHPTEVVGDLMGVLHSVTDAEVYRATLKAVKSGDGSIQLPGGQNLGFSQNSFGTQGNPHIPIVSIPTQLIAGQDTLLRSTAVAQQLYALGNRKALAELRASGNKFNTSDVLTLGRTYAHNPDPAMLKTATDLGSRTVLMNSNPLNRFVDKARAIRPGMNWAEQVRSFISGFLTPFIRVESNNLMNRFVQRSLLGIFDPYTQGQLKMGGPEADIAMSKILYGSAKMALFWAGADALTSTLSSNPNKRKELEAAGERPESVHEDGRYNASDGLDASLNPFDKHNNTAQLVAGVKQSLTEGFSKGQAGIGFRLALGSIFHEMAQQSWVHDLMPIIDDMATTDGTAMYKTNKFVSDSVSNFDPNILNQTAKWMDPSKRETITTQGWFGGMGQSVINTLESRTPGMSQKLPPDESVYGQPLANGSSVTGVHTWLHHGNGVAAATDPTIMEMNRLANLSPAAVVTPVQRTITKLDQDGNTVQDDDGAPIKMKLTNAQFSAYQARAGQYIVQSVRDEMNSPGWQSMSDKDKIAEIRSIQTDMKANAREELFSGK